MQGSGVLRTGRPNLSGLEVMGPTVHAARPGGMPRSLVPEFLSDGEGGFYADLEAQQRRADEERTIVIVGRVAASRMVKSGS